MNLVSTFKLDNIVQQGWRHPAATGSERGAL